MFQDHASSNGGDSFDKIIKTRVYHQVSHVKKLLETGRKRILVVDDEATCLMGVRALLKSLGIKVDELVDIAMTGKEAVRSVEATLSLGLDYQFIFTDISMPEMDGLEATKKIREIYHSDCDNYGPKIIGITGHSHDAFIQLAEEAGIDLVESKPMYRDKLENILRQYAAIEPNNQ